MVRRALLPIVVAACGGRVRVAPPANAAGDEVTLYRDAAFVHQRVEVDVAPAQVAHVQITVAAGLDADDVVVPDRGELVVKELHATKTDGATKLELELTAPHAGHYAVHVAYLTDLLAWDVAYTMTTTPARDRASLRGAIAIRNASGVAFTSTHVTAIDAELGNWRGKTMELLSGKLLGAPPTGTPPPTPRDLGTVALGPGQTRIEMLAGAPAQAMRSVLVYDPIGTKLDNTGGTPIRDTALGVKPPASTRVTESFEISRDQRATTGLPAGPVRLLERAPDGALNLLGEARLFDPATRVAEIDTIPVGTADGVTAHRERRELTLDEDGKRLVEEFAIAIDNARPRPVEVVVHEHLYRSQNWSLAYHSAVSAAKEGPQQIALRTVAPAKGQAKIIYVAVYTW
jgi:hypothetical protein